MSLTIHWRPTNETTKYFDRGTSTELERLKQAFGKVITDNDRPALIAMAIAADSEFYNEVAEVVATVGAIEFWGEY